MGSRKVRATDIGPHGGGKVSHGEVNARRSRVTLHVVSSLAGFIAKKDNSVSWMDSTDVCERGVTDDGAEVI